MESHSQDYLTVEVQEQSPEATGETSQHFNYDHEDPTIQLIFENILHCKEGIRQLMWFEEKMLTGYFGDQKNSVTNLEDAILGSSISNLIDGVFYCLICHEDDMIMLRYFEFGAFLNFFANECLPHFREEFSGENDAKLIPYAIYNSRDIDVANARQSKLYKERRKQDGVPGKRYKVFERNIYNNKKGVAQSIYQCQKDMAEGKLNSSLLICCVMAKSQKYNENLDKQGRDKQRFFFASKDAEIWSEKLSIFRSNPSADQEQILSILERHASVSVEDQHFILNQLPNYHRWLWYGSLRGAIRYAQRYCTSSRWYPGSPRNRIIQAFSRDDSDIIILDCLQVVFGGKNIPVRYPEKKVREKRKRKIDEVVTVVDGDEPEEHDYLFMDFQINRENLEKNMNDEVSDICIDEEVEKFVNDLINTIENNERDEFQHIDQDDASTGTAENDLSIAVECIGQFSTELSLFEYYCSELFRNGSLAWRVLTNDVNIILMNNYHQETGNFLEYDYVHVRTDRVNGIHHITCSCRTFDVAFDGVSSVCCHSRLVDSILGETVSDKCKFINKSNVLNAKMLADVNVLQLKSKGGVDRFSVKGEDDTVEFVTLFNIAKSKKVVVKCHSALCKMSQGSCRNIKSIDKSVGLCSHLRRFRTFYLSQALANNLNFDVSSIDQIFEYPDDMFEEFDDETPMVLPDEKWQDVYDPSTGMWKFGWQSPSRNIVDSDPFSDALKANIAKRLKSPVVFIPDIPSEGCDCGDHWVSADSDNELQENLEFSRKINLFSDRGVVACEVYNRKCMSGNCTIHWDGAESSVFCLSKETCAGYELGWEFVDSVLCSKQTFTGFVCMMHKKYERYSSPSPFMSVKTFIRWFFAWASHMQIEFREGCHGCEEKPKILGCDGTKIGITFKEAFVTPIEQPVKNAPPHAFTRRYDRCFIKCVENNSSENLKKYSNARLFLSEFTKLILKGNHPIDYSCAVDFKKFLPILCIPALEAMIQLEDGILKKKFAKVFKLLSFDSAIDAVLPLFTLNEIESFLEAANLDVTAICSFLDKYCPEISELIFHAAADKEMLMSVTLMLKSIIECVRNSHQFDISPEPPTPVPESYNPPKFGRAYYFSKHGSQLRDIRKFDIDSKKKQNFDDNPEQLCSKAFPVVGKSGCSYLFLWFCPIHGHCYGFHIIPGSEGRKDPAASLYMYLEEPPDIILYDFACSLSEYTHNRESGYFKNTRFYHDIFHGYTHKCTPAFRCDRIRSLSHLNTQICEQFNSFLQNIKVSGRLMSQVHFTFYTQFMIHHWNAMKRKSHEKSLEIAKLSKE